MKRMREDSDNTFELAKSAQDSLLRNDIPTAIKVMGMAIDKLHGTSGDIQSKAKIEIDEFLSNLAIKDRSSALRLARELIKKQPGWLRGWRRWLILSLPEKFINRIKETRMKPIEVLEKKIPSKTPSKTPIAVSTRAFNRLEYTTQCVDGVARQTTDIDFIHVVIDQASDDGTEQWFNWLWRNPKPFWAKLGYIRLKQNIGDWGGMILSHAILSDRYVRMMQLDNDSQLISPYTLENLAYALDILGPRGIVMCRRIGGGDIKGRTGGDVPLLPMSRSYNLILPHGRSKVYKVNHAVTCYLSERNLLDEAILLGCTAACRFRDTVKRDCRVYKFHDLHAVTIQGWDGKRYLQHEKYYRGSVATGMDYLKVTSEEIMRNPGQFIDYTLPPASDSEWLKI
jgi:predicted DNA-binding transcriptional regulator